MCIYYSLGVEERDSKKNRACTSLGITLITIPYWWNKSESSLATTIHHVRPDIDIPPMWLTSPIPLSIKMDKQQPIVPYKPIPASDVQDSSILIGW